MGFERIVHSKFEKSKVSDWPPVKLPDAKKSLNLTINWKFDFITPPVIKK